MEGTIEMKAKRVLAKLIDLVIFVLVNSIVTVLAIGAVDLILQNHDIANSITTFMAELSTLNADAGLQYIQDNREFFLFLMTLTYMSVYLSCFIYFGVLGSLVNGSLGKYVLKLGVKYKDNDKKVNMFILTLREPFFHMMIIVYLFLIIGYFFPELPLINIFPMLYIVFFFVGKDFWNQIFKVKVDTL